MVQTELVIPVADIERINVVCKSSGVVARFVLEVWAECGS